MTYDRRVAFRMADANLNRVMEGLRTLEDIARFQDLGALQGRYKEVRHGLMRAMQDWDRAELLSARDAFEDVGRTDKQPSEMARPGGLQEIAATASGRSEQGMRVLEELAKFLYPETAPAIESLRYRIYDLNAELQLVLYRDRLFLDRAQLYVLVDCRLPLDAFRDRIHAIASAGVDLIQIRDKAADAATLIAYIDAAVDAVDPRQTRVIVNDRIDVASCSKAWGGHIGQEDLPAIASRRLLRADQVLGVSTHDELQVEQALRDAADYIGCGPTFPSRTKSFENFAGLAFLARVRTLLDEREERLPAYAIGGITPENLEGVLKAGFDRIAVSACVWGASDPANIAGRLKTTLSRCRGGRGG